MVDTKHAFTVEEKVMDMLSRSKKLDKYKLVLHHIDKYGIDIVATAPGYEEFGIEIESTPSKDKWSSEEPYIATWKKGFSVPTRKKKYFDSHPLSLFIKVNAGLTRAAVVPMAFIVSTLSEAYDNEVSKQFSNNEFFVISDANHPAICYCKYEDLPSVVEEHFAHMVQLKRVNAKYTDMRPKFEVKIKKEN